VLDGGSLRLVEAAEDRGAGSFRNGAGGDGRGVQGGRSARKSTKELANELAKAWPGL
jgi:hypothetical protein